MSKAAAPLHAAEAPAQYGVMPPGQVLVDSGPLLALFNAADHWHARVVAWLQAHPALGLVSTWPVLTEVCALLARRVRVDAPADTSLAQMRRISQRFASLPLDLADASIAEAAERLGIRRIVSIDADFDVYRDARGKPLANLLRS